MNTRAPDSIIKFLTCFVFLFASLTAVNWQEVPLNSDCSGIRIDLRDPEFSDGTLTTDKGGAISAPNMRIQGKHIMARHYNPEEPRAYQVSVCGDLMFEYGNYTFTGSYLEYDFQKRKGYILNGRTGQFPWYFGAKRIDILANDTFFFTHGYITTSFCEEPEWHIHLDRANINPCLDLDACHLRLHVGRVPIFWIPRFKGNIHDLLDSPFKYRVRWSGQKGLRFSVIYKWIDWECFKTLLRLDYRLSRGPGLGVETIYHIPERCEHFCTRNYIARDSSILDPGRRLRYRLQGTYQRYCFDNRLGIYASYDKISDKEMPTDYSERGWEIKTAGRTVVNFRNQTEYSIAELTTRVRVNNFETVKESLPEFSLRLHPFSLGWTGIISENHFTAGYYEHKEAKDTFIEGEKSLPDFDAVRLEFRHSLYKSFCLGPIVNTAQGGIVAIYYNDSPEKKQKWLTVADFSYEVKTHLSKNYGWCKHGIIPYVKYRLLTPSDDDPDERYIFDIKDGWYPSSSIRFGLRNLFVQRGEECCLRRKLSADLYSYAFFNEGALPNTVPRVYSDLFYQPYDRLNYRLQGIWNTNHGNLEEINLRSEWTLNRDFAFAVEYRHRSRFSWRKVDHLNFNLDLFQSEETLLNSAVSDRRSTLLFHGYWNLSHNFALEFRLRNGWGRTKQPNYTEYQIDIKKTIRSTWHYKLCYQHKEDEHRVALYINIGLTRPREECGYCPPPSCLGW